MCGRSQEQRGQPATGESTLIMWEIRVVVVSAWHEPQSYDDPVTVEYGFWLFIVDIWLFFYFYYNTYSMSFVSGPYTSRFTCTYKQGFEHSTLLFVVDLDIIVYSFLFF